MRLDCFGFARAENFVSLAFESTNRVVVLIQASGPQEGEKGAVGVVLNSKHDVHGGLLSAVVGADICTLILMRNLCKAQREVVPSLLHTGDVPPSQPSPADDLGISIAQAAARVGMSTPTLRSWDRRYGITPSLRTDGGHRRYSASDMTRIRALVSLINEGVPSASAATAVLEWPLERCEQLLGSGRAPEEVGQLISDSGRTAGTLSLPGAGAQLRGLARSTVALDATATTQIVADAIEQRGVVRAWEEIAVPALHTIGDRWSKTASGVDIEHLASQSIAKAFDATHPVNGTGRPIILATAPDEQHDLALRALAAALRQRGCNVVLLGARVPIDALVDAATRLRPRAVVNWATMPKEYPSELARLATQRPAVKLFTAGPGWVDRADGSRLPTQQLQSLQQAVELLSS